MIIDPGKKLNDYLWFVLEQMLASGAEAIPEIITPGRSQERGSQVSLLMKKNGRKVFDQLTNAGIITDWREPDLIRLAPVPLYNSFEEVWIFADTLRQILKIQQ